MTHEAILFSTDAGLARLYAQPSRVPERLQREDARRSCRRRSGGLKPIPGARVLLITGAGRGVLRMGQDLSERDVDAGPLDLGKGPPASTTTALVRRLAALRVPVLCAVNGVAAGAGVNIALALADIVLARAGAPSSCRAFSAIGLIPDAGGTWALPHLVGQSRALGFTLLGETILAEQAESWGLIWKAVDDDRFDAEVERVARQLGNGPTRGAGGRETRHPRRPTHHPERCRVDVERDAQRECPG